MLFPDSATPLLLYTLIPRQDGGVYVCNNFQEYFIS